MKLRTALFLIISQLLLQNPLFAINVEMPGEVNAAREITPFNFSQNNFSIDPISNPPSEELGTVPNLAAQSLEDDVPLFTPSPWKGEGRGEGKRNKSTPALHPSLLPKGEKEIHTLGKKKPTQFLHKKNFALANLSDLSEVYDGSKINLSHRYHPGNQRKYHVDC